MVAALPKSLTSAEWKAKKGIIAKMAGETGIGAALDTLKKEWDKVPWAKFDAKTAASQVTVKMTVKVLDGFFEDVKKLHHQVEQVRVEVKAVRDLTAAVAQKWQRSSVIPASSRKYVAAMSTTADHLYIELKSLDRSWIELRRELEQREAKGRQMATTNLKKGIKLIRDNSTAVLKDPTVAKYVGSATTGFHQSVRGLAATLALLADDPAIAKFREKFRPLSQDSFKPKKDGDVVDHVNQILVKMTELEHLVH